mgnify:CR=1 FL=1
MSRLRFGSKYKGGSFANQFKNGREKGMSMYDGPAFGVVTALDLLKKKTKALKDKTSEDTSPPSQENVGPEDFVPKKVGSSARRMSREDYFNKSAEQAEDYARELAETQAAQAEEDERLAYDKEKGVYTDDGDLVFHDDYDAHGGKGSRQDRKNEKKQNKQQIKQMHANGEISNKEKRQMMRANRKKNRQTRRKNTKKKVGNFFRKLSDIRLKENIEFVGYSDEGFKVYEFEYINKQHGEHRYRGLMAQDLIGLELTDPDYKGMVEKENGFFKVDYSFTDVEMQVISKNENKVD